MQVAAAKAARVNGVLVSFMVLRLVWMWVDVVAKMAGKLLLPPDGWGNLFLLAIQPLLGAGCHDDVISPHQAHGTIVIDRLSDEMPSGTSFRDSKFPAVKRHR